MIGLCATSRHTIDHPDFLCVPVKDIVRILIADDDLVSRLVLQKFLQPWGTSDIAGNGKEAVDRVLAAREAGEPYDVIFLDIMMPEMDGQRALKKIRALEVARGVIAPHGAKIVMTTALGDIDTVQEAVRAKCDYFITKPVRKDTLVDALRKLALIV